MGSTEVSVFGAVVADTRLTTLAPARAGTSNPATARQRAGGVGRNVALALARLGRTVRLVSRIGAEGQGEPLLGELARAGIDVGAVGRSAGAATARYWAVLEPTGELVIGLADMAVLDELTVDRLAVAAARPCAAWFLDCNLPAASLGWLLDHPARPPLVAVDTVSVAKAARLAGRLGRVDLLFTNAAEAVALVGDAAPDRLVARLLGAGSRAVVLGRGGDGLIAADQAGSQRLAALPVPVVDVTGAGDAQAAATLHARLAGLELAAAARIGRLAAALAIAGDAAVPSDFGIPALRALALRLDSAAHAQLARL